MKIRAFEYIHCKAGRLARHDSGNVAMMFGLLLLPMLGATGLAIDFGSILTARNKGQVAADAAALQASGVARDIIKAGDGSDASTTAALAEAKSRAEKLFKVHAEQSGLKNYTPTVSVVRSGQRINTTVSYTVTTNTYIAKLFSQSMYKANGKAVSSSTLPSYSDVYLALDNSQSMGLAESQAEMIRLWNATKAARKSDSKIETCVFGCHTPSTGAKTSGETIAKANKIRMRIDVLRDAVLDMLQTAEKDADGSGNYRFALYTMGIAASLNTWELKEVSAVSGDYAKLNAAAQNIQLGAYSNPNGFGDSYIHEQITAMKDKMSASGDGSSQSKSKKYLFIISDGVRDYYKSNCTYGHCTSEIDSDFCAPLKDKGITVGVIYTTYLPIYRDPTSPVNGDWDDRYNVLVKSFAPKIQPVMAKCASDGWFYEAADGPAIETAVEKMFAQTSDAPSLTN